MSTTSPAIGTYGTAITLKPDEKKSIANLVTEELIEQWLSGDFSFTNNLQMPYVDHLLNEMLEELMIPENLVGTFELKDSTLFFHPKNLPEVELNLEINEPLTQQIQFSSVRQLASQQQQITSSHPTVKDVLSRWDDTRITEFVSRSGHNEHKEEDKELIDAMLTVGLNPNKGIFYIDSKTKDLMFIDKAHVRETGQNPLINLNKVTDRYSIEPSQNSRDKAIIGPYKTITTKEAALNLLKIVQAKANGELTDPQYQKVTCTNMHFSLPRSVLNEIEKNPNDEKSQSKKIVIENIKLTGIDFSGSTFGKGIEFKNVEFENCKFNNRCKFTQGVTFENVTFTNCEMGEIILPKNLKGVQIRQNLGDKSALRDAKIEVPHTSVIPNGNTQLDKILADMVGFVNTAVQMQAYCEKLGIKPLTTDAKAYLDAMNVLAQNLKQRGMINKNGRTEILDHIEQTNDDLDQKLTKTESELAKYEALDTGNVKITDITQDGKEKDITEQEKEYTKEQAKLAADDTRHSFKEATQLLKRDVKLILTKGIGAIKDIASLHIGFHKKTQEQQLNDIAKEMSATLTELSDLTRKYAVDMAKRDHTRGRFAIDIDGVIGVGMTNYLTKKRIERLQNKVENLIIKESEIQVQEYHREILAHNRAERDDVASTILTNSIARALEHHPEIFKNQHLNISENVSLEVRKDSGGNLYISLDNHGTITEFDSKNFLGHKIIDFSKHLSVKEQENIIKAIIEECRVQDSGIKELLDHSHSIHMKDVTIASRTLNDEYDRIYNEMSKAYEDLNAKKEYLLSAHYDNINNDLENAGGSIDDGPSLDDD